MIKKFCADLYKYFKYAVYSARAQLKSEVANSYLNWLWWILDPLCFMMIYTFIFGTVFNAREQYFPVFIFIGITMWDFFNKNVMQSVKVVKNNKPIVSKVYLPKFILIIVKMFINGFKMSISVLIIIGMLFIWKVPMTWNVLYAIPILATFFVLTFGFCTFLLHYGVFVQDLSNVVNIVLRLVFYMTGVFYDVGKRLASLEPLNEIVLNCNPLAFLLHSMRQAVLYGTPPARKVLLLWFVIGVFISWLGVRKIYKNENSYVKVI